MEILSRTCRICQETKPLSAFYFDSRKKGHYYTACKACHNHRVVERASIRREIDPVHKEQYLAMQRERYQRLYKGRYKTSHATKERMRHYGLTESQFEGLIVNQQNKCPICHKEFIETPHVDHDHETGVIRGLLCRSCNWGLHWIEKPGYVEAAKQYLDL